MSADVHERLARVEEKQIAVTDRLEDLGTTLRSLDHRVDEATQAIMGLTEAVKTFKEAGKWVFGIVSVVLSAGLISLFFN